jgi:alanyl-tRNA synthetase
MTINELREKYLQFFQEQGHAVIAGASLLPENDASVLFTTAGMHPLVPYLLGEKHPAGTRLVDCQKCIRTGDIDEVGDNGHLTFLKCSATGAWAIILKRKRFDLAGSF